MGKTLPQFQAEIARLEATHGPLLGSSPDPKTAQVTEENYGEKTTRPNVSPTYVYVFQDGTELRAVGSGGDPYSSSAESYEIVSVDETKGATSAKPSVVTGASTSERYIPVMDASGKVEFVENKNYQPTGGGPTTLNTNTSDRFILTRMPDGSLKQEDNPNYRAPAAPQGPAFSSTAGGMAYASGLRKGEAEFEAGLARERDKAQAEQRMAEYESQQRILRDQLIEDIRLGVKTTAQGKAELDAWAAMNAADYQNHARRVLDIEEYNRKLPQMQAQEDRAARSEQRAGQSEKVKALTGQAEAGRGFIDSLTKSGVKADANVFAAAYNPYNTIWAILNEAPASGPKLEAMAAPEAPTPRPMPNIVPPSLAAPAAPGAVPTAPPAPYGGDAGAQAAFEAEYPGQDAEEIWRQQRAANGGR